ncbi:MAG TPA: PAS domain-containing protein [Rhizomicrobium sp.]|nr:PAS domain-containing protein [Rhizomicrobium sp.]
MSFEAFEASILSQGLKAVAGHWNSARGARRMPGWQDLRPSAIAKQLPMVWVYAYDPATDDFIGRLGGEAINRIFGRNIKDARLSELSAIIDRDKLIARLKRVMQEPALVSSVGPMFVRDDYSGAGERIIMPLAADRQNADAVLGATLYKIEGIVPSEFEKLGSRDQWFSLDGA